MVSELSGGQRPRVAIARALAAEPQVLLLDEPLSALDLKLRQHMRTELRAIQQRVGLTFIYITHDQGEALTMSDRVAVMSQGVIEQVADGNTLYDRPQTAFVASFVGQNNALSGKVTHGADGLVTAATDLGEIKARTHPEQPLHPGDEVIIFVRPESVSFVGDGRDFENRLPVRIEKQEFEGNLWHLFLTTANGRSLKMSLVNHGQVLDYQSGDRLSVGFSAQLAVALPKGALAAE
jgi:spermidine/putrescine transport system ATP-binding protein